MCLWPLVLPFQLTLGEPTTRLGTALVLDVPSLDADLKLLKAAMLLKHLLELLSWAGPAQEFPLLGPGLITNYCLVLLENRMRLKPNGHPRVCCGKLYLVLNWDKALPAGSFHSCKASGLHFRVPSTFGLKYLRSLRVQMLTCACGNNSKHWCPKL